MTYLRQVAKEEREKREAIEKEREGKSDELAKLESMKEAAVREKEELVEQVESFIFVYIISIDNLLLSFIGQNNNIFGNLKSIKERVLKYNNLIQKGLVTANKYLCTSKLNNCFEQTINFNHKVRCKCY